MEVKAGPVKEAQSAAEGVVTRFPEKDHPVETDRVIHTQVGVAVTGRIKGCARIRSIFRCCIEKITHHGTSQVELSVLPGNIAAEQRLQDSILVCEFTCCPVVTALLERTEPGDFSQCILHQICIHGFARKKGCNIHFTQSDGRRDPPQEPVLIYGCVWVQHTPFTADVDNVR